MSEKTAKTSCKIEGCQKPYRAKGYCDRHYQQWRRGELPHPRYRTCSQEGCRKKRHLTFSLCEEHFKAKHGGGEAPAVAAPAPEVKAPETKAPAQAKPAAEKPATETKPPEAAPPA